MLFSMLILGIILLEDVKQFNGLERKYFNSNY